MKKYIAKENIDLIEAKKLQILCYITLFHIVINIIFIVYQKALGIKSKETYLIAIDAILIVLAFLILIYAKFKNLKFMELSFFVLQLYLIQTLFHQQQILKSS